MNHKYTVVIPTLWKSNRIHKLLKDLILCTSVGEIILIDNNNKFNTFYTKLRKVRVISPGYNIYVNPAWNLGVAEAKNDSIALVNDDINFNTIIFEVITPEILNVAGIIGMGEGNYSMSEDDNSPYIERWHTGMNDGGWGCFIMFDKDNWIDIPDIIKIWYGDNFIKDKNPCKKSVLRNFNIDTEMSTTSDESIWDNIKHNDYIEYMKL